MARLLEFFRNSRPGKAAKKNSYGFIVPAFVFLVELIMWPTHRFLGSQQPALESTDQTAKLAYFRQRAVKIDALVAGKILISILLLNVASPGHPLAWLAYFVSVAFIVNVKASVFHYSVFPEASGMVTSKHDIQVLFLPRIVIIALLNYIEIVLCFATIYRLHSGFTIGGISDSKLPDAFTAVYFSTVTAMTVGYGDIYPTGISRAYVIAEIGVSLLLISVLIGRSLSSMNAIRQAAETREI
jgi:hypothetical protein